MVLKIKFILCEFVAPWNTDWFVAQQSNVVHITTCIATYIPYIPNKFRRGKHYATKTTFVGTRLSCPCYVILSFF